MTVETLPPAPDFEFGKVVGRVIHAIADTAEDVDDKPQARAAAGKVIFTPQETLRVVTTPGQQSFVAQGPVTANLSATGRVLDAEGRNGIWLVTGTWKVTFDLNPVDGRRVTLPELSIAVTTAHTDAAPLDLSSALPYVPPPNTTVQTLLVPSGGSDGDVLTKSGPGLAWTPPSGGAWGEIDGTLADQTDLQAALNGKVPTSRTVAGKALSADVTLAKADVGLGNVDNTSDANKPISTATQAALDGKAATGHTHTASQVSDSTATGRAVLTAVDGQAARTAIGAGTSSLVVGTGAGDAKAGNYTPPIADLPAGSTIRVLSPTTTRPTARTDITVIWIGYATEPTNWIDGDIWLQP